jgi:hypothetical protein
MKPAAAPLASLAGDQGEKSVRTDISIPVLPIRMRVREIAPLRDLSLRCVQWFALVSLQGRTPFRT